MRELNGPDRAHSAIDTVSMTAVEGLSKTLTGFPRGASLRVRMGTITDLKGFWLSDPIDVVVGEEMENIVGFFFTENCGTLRETFKGKLSKG